MKRCTSNCQNVEKIAWSLWSQYLRSYRDSNRRRRPNGKFRLLTSSLFDPNPTTGHDAGNKSHRSKNHGPITSIASDPVMMDYETNTLSSKGNVQLQPDCAIPRSSDDNFSFSAALVLKSDLSTPRLGWPWSVRRNRRHSSFPPRRYYSATKRYDLSSFYTKSEVSAEGLPWEVGRDTGIPKDVSRCGSKNWRWPADKTTFPFRLPAGGQKMCRQLAMLASPNPGHENYRNQEELILPIRLSPALWSLPYGRVEGESTTTHWKYHINTEDSTSMLKCLTECSTNRISESQYLILGDQASNTGDIISNGFSTMMFHENPWWQNCPKLFLIV